MKTLALTSPLTRGPAVERAQRRLARNPFKQDYLQGAVDGEFGEETGRACRRAKYWLGYETAKQTPVYGDVLDGYLGGKAPLPKANAVRRAARLKAKKREPLRVKALAKLVSKLGYVEGRNNDSEFGRWYGLNNNPYCAMAVSWAYVGVGSKAFAAAKGRYAYCPFIYNDARAGENGLALVRDPLPGDLVLFNWDGDWDADHVGLFEGWKDRKRGYFTSVEANTSPDDSGSQSNGGGVHRRGERPGKGDTRHVRQVQGFVRVGR